MPLSTELDLAPGEINEFHTLVTAIVEGDLGTSTINHPIHKPQVSMEALPINDLSPVLNVQPPS